MNKKINLTYIGIDFLINVELDKNGEIVKVTQVKAWNDDQDKYIKIPCDLDAFLKEMGVLLRGKL